MIDYSPGRWQVALVFRCSGSVFPKAAAWAIPSTLLAVLLHKWVIERDENMSVSQFSSYNFVLGFLVVFRSQQAYSRFWEAATIVQQVRGEWFNAISSCVAFCSTKPERHPEVQKFQNALIRLASLLYCSSLQQIAVLQDEAFDIIEVEGFQLESLEYLAAAPEKALVIMQWIQQLIMHNAETGVITAPPPILSRVFQELSRGIVNIVNAQKITDIVFPFPYAQMVSAMLMASALITPIALATIMNNVTWCAVLNFVSVFSFWAINYIAAEIEMPFGDDPNDLPVAALQRGFNQALITLADERCAKCPDFEMNETTDACNTVPCPFYLVTDISSDRLSSDHFKERKLKTHISGTMAKSEALFDDKDVPVSKARRATQCMQVRVKSEGLEYFRAQESMKSLKSSVASEHHVSVAKDFPFDRSASMLQVESSDNASNDPPSQVTTSADQLASGSQNKVPTLSPTEAPLQSMSLATGSQITDQLGEVMAKLEQRFALVVTNLGLLSKGHSCNSGAMFQESQLLTLSSLLDNHMALLVKELDKIVQACAEKAICSDPACNATRDRHWLPVESSVSWKEPTSLEEAITDAIPRATTEEYIFSETIQLSYFGKESSVS
eukprot:TRINITY_DN32054_c0_g1_i1.p1 TRINITY_DN32054_c0_g1~~TRINITY_DN32054_c0_g1_i1.p1  ORF type:complete len:612 (-),score=110.19 TRINITY_DN32054_c0_g1_i1:58-1893(-)